MEYLLIGGVLLVGVVIWCVTKGKTSPVAPPPYATNTIGGGLCEKAVAMGATAYASSKGVPPQAASSLSAMGAPTLCNVIDKVVDTVKSAPVSIAKSISSSSVTKSLTSALGFGGGGPLTVCDPKTKKKMSVEQYKQKYGSLSGALVGVGFGVCK